MNILKWLRHLLGFGGPRLEARDEAKPTPKVVLTLPDGQKLTTAELAGLTGRMDVRDGKLVGVTGNVRYEVIRGENIPARAAELHQQGRGAGSRGDYKTAIACFEQASELAPSWPYPVYDRAFTHLLMKEFDAAKRYYQKTVELSPGGFFTAITALDTLDRENDGDLPPGTYLAYLSLEWMKDPVQREAAIREMVERLPQFAPAWKEYAALCKDESDRLRAIEKGLAAEPDAETRGMLAINRALILNLEGDREAALLSLGQLALDRASTLGTQHSAKAAISILTMEANA